MKRPSETDVLLSGEKKRKYRSSSGSLLYLVKHSRPDLANCVRELSKVNISATAGNYKQLIRALKFIETTKMRGIKYKLKVKNEEVWKLTCFRTVIGQETGILGRV